MTRRALPFLLLHAVYLLSPGGTPAAAALDRPASLGGTVSEVIIPYGSRDPPPEEAETYVDLPLSELEPVRLSSDGGRALTACRSSATCPEFAQCAGIYHEISVCKNLDLEEKRWQRVPAACPADHEDHSYGPFSPSECATAGGKPSAKAARNRHTQGTPSNWAGQVLHLRRVYVDSAGRVFNSTHVFDFGWHRNDDVVYQRHTKVLRYRNLVNMLLHPEPGQMQYLETAVKLPLFLSLAELMPRIKQHPWAIQNRKSIQLLWRPVLGFDLMSQSQGPLEAASVDDTTLIFADNLFQALPPPPGAPSVAQWHAFRSRHLLPPGGLPLFTPDLELKDPADVAVSPRAPRSSVSMEWRVVLSYARLSVDEEAEMRNVQSLLQSLFHPDRVEAYNGQLSFTDTRALFSQALLFVSFSSPALTNLIFMPFNASVLEIALPSSSSAPPGTPGVYQKLAEACGVRHYLLSCGDAPGSNEEGAAATRRLLAEVRSCEAGSVQGGGSSTLGGVWAALLRLGRNAPQRCGTGAAPLPCQQTPSRGLCSSAPVGLRLPPSGSHSIAQWLLSAVPVVALQVGQLRNIGLGLVRAWFFGPAGSGVVWLKKYSSQHLESVGLFLSSDSDLAGRDGAQRRMLQQGSLLCNRERVQEVLERIQHDVYSSDWFDPKTLDRTGRGFKDWIPGSAIETAEQRARLEQWQDCVTLQGRWAYDPNPRTLPWEYRGTSNYCDNRWKAEGGFVGRDSQVWVQSGMGPAGWRIRPSLKYVWSVPKTCGMWPSVAWHGQKFCATVAGGGAGLGAKEGARARGRHILILGDSLQEQFVRTIVNNVVGAAQRPANWAVEESVPEECEAWRQSKRRLSHNYCRLYKINGTVCPNLTISFIRNDHLQISGNEHKFDRQPWARMKQVVEADVVVLNRGAHFRSNKHFLQGLRSAVRHIRDRFPNKLIIFRNSSPGHANCTAHDLPLKQPQNPLLLPNPYKFPYMWDKFAAQNEIARRVVEEVGGVYMDVDTMTAYRADSHQGVLPGVDILDCLHYCIPGPLDGWAQLLFNLLLKITKK